MTLKSWFYDHIASKYYDNELAEATSDVRKRCVDLVGLKPGDTVVDLGCGTGLNQPFLAEAVGEEGVIIGVDASSGMLAQAQSRAEAGGYAARLKLIEGDARKIDDLVSVQPDAVITTLFFSVVPDWRDVFSRSFNMVRPGGRYLVMDTYWTDASVQLRILLLRYAAGAAIPGFEPLQTVADDFSMENYPPDADLQFYIATGTKPVEI